MERDQVVLADEDVDLICRDAVSIEAARREPCKEQPVRVHVELWAGLSVPHVFDCERVELEPVAELRENAFVGRRDIHPHQACATRKLTDRSPSQRLHHPGLVDPPNHHRRH